MNSEKKLQGLTVNETGWAGPLLWLSIDRGFSIHLYDASIKLNGDVVNIGDDLNSNFVSKKIKAVQVDGSCFCLIVGSDQNLKISMAIHETARIFIKGNHDSHYVYKNGTLKKDED